MVDSGKSAESGKWSTGEILLKISLICFSFRFFNFRSYCFVPLQICILFSKESLDSNYLIGLNLPPCLYTVNMLKFDIVMENLGIADLSLGYAVSHL